MSGMVRLRMLWVIEIPSTLLWEPVTIGHLNPPRVVQAAALAQRYEPKPWECMADLGRGLGERGSDFSSLAHRSAEAFF
jgi:hypothetical protein